MTRAKRMQIFASAYSNYMNIENDADLKKECLTLADYKIAFDVLRLLSGVNGSAIPVFSSGVAEWFRRAGFIVDDPHENEVNYTISI